MKTHPTRQPVRVASAHLNWRKGVWLCWLVIAQISSLHAAGFDQKSYTAVADTYIDRGAPTANSGDSTTFLVKRNAADTTSGTDRIGYLRFEVGAPPVTVDSASLYLTFSQYPGDGTTPFIFEVYGLPDGHPDEGFDEKLLNFSNAANASTTAPGGFNTSGVTLLGTFTPSVPSGVTTVEFTGTGLRNFLADSGNTRISLAIVRQTPNTGLPSFFHSSESATLSYRPTLVLRSPGSALAVAATTASSALADSPPSKATDGDAATRWIADVDTSSTKSWITLDLGTAQTINRSNFIAYQHGRTYKLESSDNNSTWSLVASDFRSGIGSGVNALEQDTDLYFQPRSARYFRLTSLTSTVGKSVSIWEVQLSSDPAASAILARIASLTSSVAALPNTATADRIKRAVLDISLERAQASINIGEFAHAGRMLDDVANNLATSANQMAAQATGLPNIRVLRPLLEITTAANPYLKRLNDGANLFLAVTDPPWEKNTPEVNVHADFNLARTTGQQMDALFWAFAHPNSPLKDNPEILRRLLRRSYAYLDAINVHGPLLPAGQLAGFYDDFAIAPASSVFRELPVLYPGLVPANSGSEWGEALTTAASNLWAAYEDRIASWVNTDVAIAVELFNFGTPTNRPELLAKAKYFIDAVLSSGRMFEDGAVGYIGTQNETTNYQATVSEYVTRYYETTGYTPAGTILQKMQWYGAINGRLGDWWTVPSWKDAWNDIRSCFSGGESAAGTNPYVRAELNAFIAGAATATNWYGRPRVDVAWYQSGTTPLSRPDYTVFDRNTQGPRAWYGRWNYSATLRNIADSEPGHYTLIGAQVADPDPDFRVNASLMGIFPRIRVSASPGRNADNSLNESGHAWLTSKLAGDSTVSRDFSAMGVSYLVHQYGSATKGAEYDWTGRQVWLNLPDRVIGLLDIAPNANLSAYEVQGVIRLGFGGTSYSSTKTLVATGANAWDYGDLRIKLHDHNYTDVTPEVYFFRVANAPTTEITLRDMVDGATKTTPTAYSAGTRRKFLAEVRPASAVGEITVTEIADPGGLIGLDVNNPSTGRRYRVVYNPGTVAANYTPNLDWTGPVRIHQSGARHRPDWLPDATGPLASTYLTSGQVAHIQPRAHIVLERGGSIIKANNPNALDQSSSWTNGPMTDGGIAVWDSTVTSSNTTTVGNGLNLAGISIGNPAGNVTINSGTSRFLAIGSAGIDTTGSTRTLSLGAPIRLDAQQPWITGSSGTPASTQIIANGVLSGSGGLTISAAADRRVELNAANTFSGGLVLGGNAGIDYSASAALGASGGLVTSSPFGTGPIAINGGSLIAGNKVFFNPSVSINGDFTWSTTARVDTSGAFNLGGATRSIMLARSVTPANVVVSGGNNSIRFTVVTGGISANSFSNGDLKLAVAASVAPPNFVVATFGTTNGNKFMDNAGIIVGPRVYISPSFTSAPFGAAATERPAVTLEAGGYLSLSDGGNGRGHSIFSLAGLGTVINNTSGTGARTDTLTIDGGLKTSTSDFAGVIRDRDTTTFPTANSGLVTALTKAGNTTQILSGINTHSGATTVVGGILRVTGGLANTAALSIASGATFENQGSVSVSGDITNSGTMILKGNATLSVSGIFTNNGVLDATAWTGSLPVGIVNNGTILPPSGPDAFADWQNSNWPGNNDPNTIATDADPDRDGTNNLLEWALGLDPKIPDCFMPVFTDNGVTLKYTYNRNRTASGAAFYQVEWFDSFADGWSTAGVVADPPVALSTSLESVRASIPRGSSGKRFVRLKVTKF